MSIEIMKRMTEMNIEERKVTRQVGRKHMEEAFDKKKVIEEAMRYFGLL